MVEREENFSVSVYQFWLKVADADVYKFLKYFTFLSIEEIDAIEAKDKASGTKPEAQRILAKEMTRLIHGEEALAAAQPHFRKPVCRRPKAISPKATSSSWHSTACRLLKFPRASTWLRLW